VGRLATPSAHGGAASRMTGGSPGIRPSPIFDTFTGLA
jgi:hypothetical protein